MFWREHSARIIREIISEYGHDQKEMKKKLFEAYPFGQRRYHPYKIWCDEIRAQLGLKKSKSKNPANKDQGNLFE